MTDRKKPGVAFWATVMMVVVLVAYPLSFGPACWWLSEPIEMIAFSYQNTRQIPGAYWPIAWAAKHGPKPLQRMITWFAKGGRDAIYYMQVDGDGWNGAVILL